MKVGVYDQNKRESANRCIPRPSPESYCNLVRGFRPAVSLLAAVDLPTPLRESAGHPPHRVSLTIASLRCQPVDFSQRIFMGSVPSVARACRTELLRTASKSVLESDKNPPAEGSESASIAVHSKCAARRHSSVYRPSERLCSQQNPCCEQTPPRLLPILSGTPASQSVPDLTRAKHPESFRNVSAL